MKLVSRKNKGYQHVYDISVEGNENFLAAGAVVHNSGARKLCEDVQPTAIDDIAVITATYRPGPLKAGVHLKFVDAKNQALAGKMTFPHPIIEEVLGKTYGFICYQEQFMILAQKLGGFTPAESDALRKTLVKKSLDTIGKKGDERAAAKEKFIEGAQRLHGVSPTISEPLWKTIENMSVYCFNKCLSHNTLIAVIEPGTRGEVTINISEAQPGMLILSRDEKTQENVYVEIKALHDTGIQEVFEVVLDTGERVTCTMNHKFRTTCGQMLPLRQIIAENLSIFSV